MKYWSSKLLAMMVALSSPSVAFKATTKDRFAQNNEGSRWVQVQFLKEIQQSLWEWKIHQDDTILFHGSELGLWDSTFEGLFPAGTFQFTVSNSACADSDQGEVLFEIWLLDDDGDNDVILASQELGDDGNCEQTVDFVVPQDNLTQGNLTQDDQACQDKQGQVVKLFDDTPDTFEDEPELKDCAWLADNLATNEFLCDWTNAAFNCPATCQKCEDLANLTCEDSTDAIEMDFLVGEQDCLWLADNMGPDYGYLCDRTAVALHCPLTCNTAHCGEEVSDSTDGEKN